MEGVLGKCVKEDEEMDGKWVRSTWDPPGIHPGSILDPSWIHSSADVLTCIQDTHLKHNAHRGTYLEQDARESSPTSPHDHRKSVFSPVPI